MTEKQEIMFDEMHDTIIKLNTFIRETLVKEVDGLKKTTYGNGKPGLKIEHEINKKDISDLKQLHLDCKEARERDADRKPSNLSNLISIGALIVAVVSIWVSR